MVPEPSVVACAGDPKHRSTRPGGQLDGDGANAPRGAGDRDGVPRSELQRTDRCVRRGARDVERTRHVPRHTRGLGGQLVGGDRDELGVAGAAQREADDLVTDRETRDALAEFGHHTREIAALTGRKGGGPSVVKRTLADHRLTRVDARSLDGHQDLALARNRTRHVPHLEHVDVAISVELHCSTHMGYDHEVAVGIPSVGGSRSVVRLGTQRRRGARQTPSRPICPHRTRLAGARAPRPRSALGDVGHRPSGRGRGASGGQLAGVRRRRERATSVISLVTIGLRMVATFVVAGRARGRWEQSRLSQG